MISSHSIDTNKLFLTQRKYFKESDTFGGFILLRTKNRNNSKNLCRFRIIRDKKELREVSKGLKPLKTLEAVHLDFSQYISFEIQ